MFNNKLMYALLLGLYLMRETIPVQVLNYVYKYSPKVKDREVWLALTCLRNTPDMKDEVLHECVIKLL